MTHTLFLAAWIAGSASLGAGIGLHQLRYRSALRAIRIGGALMLAGLIGYLLTL